MTIPTDNLEIARRLIEASSLGTARAVRLRASAPPALVAEALDPKPGAARSTWHYHQADIPDSTEGNTMSNSNNRHVVQNPNGGWDVKKPDGNRASAHTDTQAAAIDRAREIVHNQGGGEVRIHGRDGRIRDSDTIAPGNDPNPPRDRK